MDGRLGFNGMLPVYHARESLKFISKVDGMYKEIIHLRSKMHTQSDLGFRVQ